MRNVRVKAIKMVAINNNVLYRMYLMKGLNDILTTLKIKKYGD